MDSDVEGARRHAARVIAYFRALVDGGMNRQDAREMARSYSTDILFADMTRRTAPPPDEGEPWKG